MKTIIITFALALTCTVSASAKNSLTNTLHGVLKMFSPKHIGGATYDISYTFNVGVCIETDNSDYVTEAEATFATYTNATLGVVLDSIINANTNYVLRHIIETDRLYIHPKTNAVTMMRCDSIAFTNESLLSVMGESDKLGFKNLDIDFFKHRTSYYLLTRKISIQLENPFVWQVLDAIMAQLPSVVCWRMKGNTVYFIENYDLRENEPE